MIDRSEDERQVSVFVTIHHLSVVDCKNLQNLVYCFKTGNKLLDVSQDAIALARLESQVMLDQSPTNKRLER